MKLNRCTLTRVSLGKTKLVDLIVLRMWSTEIVSGAAELRTSKDIQMSYKYGEIFSFSMATKVDRLATITIDTTLKIVMNFLILPVYFLYFSIKLSQR